MYDRAQGGPIKAVRRLRELLAEDAIILAPGCHDALGAYFIQKAGFKTAYMTGYGAACSLLGRPDLGELTMTEIVDHAGRIAAAIEIPLICDADSGYGGPLNVQRTVQAFQKAGVAAIHIEDQVEPKRCAAMKEFAVTDLDTAVKKIRAAVSAKEEPDFIIIARTDSRPLLGLDHAVERARAFGEAGADMVYVEMLRSKEEVVFVAESVKEAPLLFDSFDHPEVPALSASELEEMGYKIVTYPFTATLAYAKILDQIYSGISAKKGAQHLASLRMNFHDFEKIMKLEEIWRKVDAL